ncbi:tRNA modification GTPase [Thalassoroseus pseudoceratinae]|uniref:tRNA modification GTPase n=1 Tax=Thalassoroseus pseudoceratinae TaxID=2713176 RepID=UPI00141F6A8F|nr:tRNA modification GTPase [Thalassoroseus pseudoceratinae]
MQLQWDDTIAALASPPGAALRGIVRISGPDVREAVSAIFHPDDEQRWQATRSSLRHPGQLTLPDLPPIESAVLLWPGRRSYTGEPLAEIHTLGSPPLLEAILSALFSHNIRPARAGEFTLRSFLNGRIDLTQAEAVLGVIDAEDHQELNAALQQLAGGLSSRLATVRSDLLDLLADLEAGLDFVDEDIQFVSTEEVTNRLSNSLTTIRSLLSDADTRMQSSVNLRVVLAGLPNAGKSSLFNTLTGSDAALVSDEQGTTRDYITGTVRCGEMTIELIDTAGAEPVSPTRDIMHQASELRTDLLKAADMILFCSASRLSSEEAQWNAEFSEELSRLDRPILAVQTKSDLVDGDAAETLAVSTSLPESFAALKSAIADRLTERQRGERQLIGSTAARCRESLQATESALQEGMDATHSQAGEELIALEIRTALDHLGRILGTVYTDDILDRIFSKFCIGK